MVIHVTKQTAIGHTEFRMYEKRVPEKQLSGHDGLHLVSPKTHKVYSYIFTKKEYFTVQLTSTVQSQ